jgi:hypothetical protein
MVLVIKPYALATLYLQEDSWYSFLLDAVDPRAMVQLEGLGKLTLSRIEPATFRFIA